MKDVVSSYSDKTGRRNVRGGGKHSNCVQPRKAWDKVTRLINEQGESAFLRLVMRNSS